MGSRDKLVSDVNLRRSEVVMAGHRGDEAGARKGWSDPDASVRAAALSAIVRLRCIRQSDVDAAIGDDVIVRRTLCELATEITGVDLDRLLNDEDASVVEAAANAAGELGEQTHVELLCRVARHHNDPLCRESAVAALGAIGDPATVFCVIEALNDTVQIRRRAVIALRAFSRDDVTASLETTLSDRDWQVRQAAEDVLSAIDEEPN